MHGWRAVEQALPAVDCAQRRDQALRRSGCHDAGDAAACGALGADQRIAGQDIVEGVIIIGIGADDAADPPAGVGEGEHAIDVVAGGLPVERRRHARRRRPKEGSVECVDLVDRVHARRERLRHVERSVDHHARTAERGIRAGQGQRAFLDQRVAAVAGHTGQGDRAGAELGQAAAAAD